VDIARLIPGARVRFPDSEAVTLISVTPGAFWQFYYDGPDGPGKLVLAEPELGGIELVDTVTELRFDGDPTQFRLGVGLAGSR